MASKSKSRRRVLRASCLLAALIVAGSSFAWFTSKDEVTNRLSASGDYDVTIAEDFTPPENWLPGQKVDKNVGAVNTGTIDAFVRMWLEGEMKVLNEKRDTQKFDEITGKFTDGTNATLTTADAVTAEGVISSVTRETDEDLIAKNLTYYYTPATSTSIYDKVSLKELDKTNLYNNPNSPITTVSSPDGYTEVMALQAGGELVYVKTDNGEFEFTFKPNQTQTIVSAGYTNNSTDPATEVGGTRYDILGGKEYTVKVGTAPTTGDDIEVTNDSTTPKYEIKVKDLDTFYKYLGGNIDTNTFEPCTTGLYIFKRNSDLKTDNYEDSEYTGYYYVAKASDDTGADGKFFALQYENDGTSTRSDYVLDKDTYSITRDDKGNVTFVPYRVNGTKDGKNAVLVGVKHYDASTGEEIKSGTWAANTDSNIKDKSVTLYTAKTNVIENSKLTWTYNDNLATPTVNDTITIGSTTYRYGSDGKWKNGDADAPDQAAINAAYAKLGLEVEDNGVVYTYDAAGSTWKAAGADNPLNTTDDADLIARLNAAVTKKATLTATYYGAENAAVLADSSATNNTKDDISVVVNLNNVNGSVAEAWTAIEATRASADTWGSADSDKVTFYYNNDVEEGASTKKLVDSVELSKDTQKNAYLGFDFDLNVNMESMQITIDDNGTESGENIKPWASTTNAVGATGTVANADPSSTTEISSITWAQ